MLEHFDEVAVVARVADATTTAGVLVEGPRVRVCPLPDYVGARQAALRYRRVERALRAQTDDSEAHFAGKVPGLIASLLARVAHKHNRPLLVNVVGDPQDVLSTGTLGPIGVGGSTCAKVVLRRLVRSADAVVYVSEHYLQRKYPARTGAIQLVRSDVMLTESAFAAHSHHRAPGAPLRLITVGSQDQLYKGHDLLINAMERLRRIGSAAELHLVGAGRRQTELSSLARQHNLGNRVIFHGHVGDVTQLRALLDQADVYVQPSRTEGVPRALIEAMARQLPCIGSDAGGIPELLDGDAIFAVDDMDQLVTLIQQMDESEDRRRDQGRRNQEQAHLVAQRSEPARYAAFFGAFANPEGGTSGPPRTRNVLHLLGSLDRGGAEMRTLQLIRAVDPTRFTSIVMTLSGRTGSLEDDFAAAGASVHPLSVYRLGFALRFMAFLRKHRIDVVHSNVHFSSGPLLFIAAVAGVPIRIAHFRSDGVEWSALPRPRRIQYAIMRSMVWTWATQVIAVSPSALANARRRGRTAPKGVVIPNGVDLRAMDPSRTPRVSVSMTSLPDEPLILHLGRADIPTKNREGAIRYFAAYCNSGGSGTLVFAGRDGADEGRARANRERWRSQAERLCVEARIVWLGERTDVANLLVSADLLLFTSQLEGLPGVIIEARALGTPVVTSNVPGAVYLAEQLSDVTVVHTTEPCDWAAAMADSLSRPVLPASRDQSHKSLVGSAFDSTSAAHSFEKVWTGIV